MLLTVAEGEMEEDPLREPDGEPDSEPVPLTVSVADFDGEVVCEVLCETDTVAVADALLPPVLLVEGEPLSEGLSVGDSVAEEQ